MEALLNYKHLRYFWAVAQEGSVTRAAKRLGMTAQTVSGQISALERSLGKALFQQQGRTLVLTEAGRLTLRYADQIFLLGEELQDALQDEHLGQALRLTVGISDVVPKAISLALLRPVLSLAHSVRMICHEGPLDDLLAKLTLHRLDIVLTDRPAVTSQTTWYTHLLAKCPVVILGKTVLAERYRAGFPGSLQQAPFLLPTRHTMLRSQLEQWFTAVGVKIRLVGEFDDGALLTTFGQQGLGLFPTPLLTHSEPLQEMATRELGDLVGPVDGVFEHYYAVFNRRKIIHPAVQAIYNAADPQGTTLLNRTET